MGDRTWVEIVVLTESLPQVKEFLDEEAQISEGNILTSLYYHAVNNGCIEEQHELTKAGIPYNYEWGKGDYYTSGTKYIRFTPEGELEHIEYCESDINPPIEKLLELVPTPRELAEYVQQYSDELTPLPWDNQVEYGKRFRTLQLLNT